MPSDSTAPAAAPARAPFIAPLWHTFSILLIFGFFSFLDAHHAQKVASSQAAAPHSAVLRGYLLSIFFGLAHSYQGWKHVIVIVALGILYGALVAWRRNLRDSMIAHAWSDLFEGWLRFV
jgi:Type II CAAX prenyl endopeptidase Rce1-like